MPPDGHRSEGTLSLGEVPYVRVKPFGLPFRRLEKVTRRKGHPFQGLLVLAALITLSVETCACTAVPWTHVLGLGTLGPRGLFATCLGWMLLASSSKRWASFSRGMTGRYSEGSAICIPS